MFLQAIVAWDKQIYRLYHQHHPPRPAGRHLTDPLWYLRHGWWRWPLRPVLLKVEIELFHIYVAKVATATSYVHHSAAISSTPPTSTSRKTPDWPFVVSAAWEVEVAFNAALVEGGDWAVPHLRRKSYNSNFICTPFRKVSFICIPKYVHFDFLKREIFRQWSHGIDCYLLQYHRSSA